ncbi:hypothetical protein EJD97_010803, partial [Solanum chilense]
RRIPARRVDENEEQEEILPQVEEVEKGAQGDQVPIVGEAGSMTTQVNLSMMPRPNVVESTMTSRLRDFVRMNPPIYHGSKKNVAQVWYTQWKDNRREESGHIEREEFKEVFLADLVRDECRTEMLHDDMTVARLMVYAQLVEESKLRRMARNLKRGESSDHEQTRVKKRAQTQEAPSSAKVKFEKGGGSRNEKPTCVTYGKRHYGKCLAGNSGCFGFGKDDHKVRDCPTTTARGRESKKVAPSTPKEYAPITRRFYELLTR